MKKAEQNLILVQLYFQCYKLNYVLSQISGCCKLKKIVETAINEELGYNQYSSATKFEWAPNGRLFITARLYPIRRVDNGYCLWDYCGMSCF